MLMNKKLSECIQLAETLLDAKYGAFVGNKLRIKLRYSIEEWRRRLLAAPPEGL